MLASECSEIEALGRDEGAVGHGSHWCQCTEDFAGQSCEVHSY